MPGLSLSSHDRGPLWTKIGPPREGKVVLFFFFGFLYYLLYPTDNSCHLTSVPRRATLATERQSSHGVGASVGRPNPLTDKGLAESSKLRSIMKQGRATKYPHYVMLPKNAISPTGSIYKYHDIVQQTKALVITTTRFKSTKPGIIRCQEPFIIRVSINGKVKDLHSKVK